MREVTYNGEKKSVLHNSFLRDEKNPDRSHHTYLIYFHCGIFRYSRKNPNKMSGVFGSFLIVYISSNRIPYSSRMLSQLFCLLSPMYMTSGSALREYRLIGGSGHYLTALQYAPILYIVLSIALIASGYFIYTNKK